MADNEIELPPLPPERVLREGQLGCDDTTGYDDVDMYRYVRAAVELNRAKWERQMEARNALEIRQQIINVGVYEELRKAEGRIAELARDLTAEVAASNRQYQELATAQAKISELEAQVYVPGTWRCAKCKLILVASKLNASTGGISADNEPQRCANGCGPMWRRTEREAGNELCDRLEAAHAKLAELEKQDPFAGAQFDETGRFKFFTVPGVTCESLNREGLVPVYLRPVPAQERKPLTEDEINQFAAKHLKPFAQFIGSGETWVEGEIEFARAIERAHRINDE